MLRVFRLHRRLIRFRTFARHTLETPIGCMTLQAIVPLYEEYFHHTLYIHLWKTCLSFLPRLVNGIFELKIMKRVWFLSMLCIHIANQSLI